MKNLYLFFCIICLMLSGIANSSANTFDFSSLKLNDRPHVLLSKVAVPTPKITASSTTICKGSKVTLTATACTNGVLKWTDGLEGNSITVSPAATKSYRVLCKLNSAPAGSPTMSDSSTAVKITVNPIPVAPKITSNTYCNNPVSVLGDISFGGDNTDYLSSTCIAKDGALIMIGYSASSNTGDKSQASKGGSDYWVVKVNATGTKVWDKTFGGTGDDVPLSIIATSDGGFLISGYSNSPKSGDKSEASKGGYDYWLVKIDANGTKVWDKSFGGSGSDYANSIIATSDNNFLITGHSDSEIGGNKSVGTKGSLDYWIVKIKPDGTKIWDKAYGGSGVEYLASITTTKEGGFLLAGHSNSLAGGDKTESTKGSSDYWLVKIDANGTKIWDKSYGASSQEELSTIAPTFDGGYILGGISNSKAGGDKIGTLLGGFDYWIVKVNADGTKLWDKVFGGSDTEYFAKVLPTADGGCLLGGTSYSKISGNKSETSVNGDFWLVKLTADGSKAWDKVVGGNSADVLKDMFLSENGRVVLNGYSFSDAGSSKRQPSKGSSDYWTVYTQVCDNSYKPYTNLVATGCTGVVTWSNNATGSTITVSPSVATNFTATCSVNGCVSVASNSITVNPPKPATPSIAASSTSVCAGSPVVLSSSNSLNGTITWTGGTKGSSITIYPTATKVYKSVCNVNGINSDSSNSITITVLPKPTQPKITATNSSICIGSSTTLTSSACTGGVTTWTGGLTGSSITVSPTKTTIYKASCTVNTCRSDSSAATTITVIDKPSQPKITASSTSICQGGSSILTSSACTGGTLTWTGGLTGSSITVSPTTPQSYRVLCTVSGCKSDSSEAVIININPLPVAPSINTNITCNNPVLSQWNKTIKGNSSDYLSVIVPTSDGGYLLGGYSFSAIGDDKSEVYRGSADYWIVKINASGAKVWDKTFGGNGYEVLSTIISTTDGGFLLGGHSASDVSGEKTEATRGNYDYWIVKINADGKKIWDKTFGGNDSETLSSIVATSDGGFLLGGYSVSGISGEKSEASKGNADFWLVKINAYGTKLWDKTLGGSSLDALATIIPASDGGYLLGGYSDSPISGDKSQNTKGTYDYWLVKINDAGAKVWDKTFGTNKLDQLTNLISTTDGGYLLGGISSSGVNGDKTSSARGNYDYWIIKINSIGAKVWDKSFGTNANDFFVRFTTIGGGYLLGGYTTASTNGDKLEATKGGNDYWVIKIDENGAKVWEKAYGGNKNDNLTYLIPTNDGSFILGGNSNSSISGDKSETTVYDDIWLIKIKESCEPNKILATQKPTLTASGCTGTVNWSNGATGSSISVNPTTTTTYKATCMTNGCSSGISNAITVIGSATKPITPTIIANNTTTCSGIGVMLSASACNSGTLNWTGGLTGSSITVSINKTKSYRVVCNQNGINSDSSVAVTINVLAKPAQPKITPSSTSICQGSNTTLTSTACTGGTLIWTGGSTGSSITLSPTTTKSYKVVCTVNGCNSDSSTAVTVTVKPVPNPPVISTGIACSNPVTAQWNKVIPSTYGNYLTSMVATADGGFITGGYLADKENDKDIARFYVSKVDANGVKIWDKTFGKGRLEKIVATKDGGYLLGGYSSETTITSDKSENPKGIIDYWVVKINSNGDKLWDKTFGGSATNQFSTMVAVSDGGFLLGGFSDSGSGVDKSGVSRGRFDYWVVKINSSGTKAWDRTFGGAGNDYLASIITTSDGGFLLGGSSNSKISSEKTEAINTDPAVGYLDYWVVKINKSGTKLWDKTFGGKQHDSFRSMIATTDGGYLLGGYSNSELSGNKSQSAYASGQYNDFWVVKIDANGAKLWDKVYGGNLNDNLSDMLTTTDGGFILGGSSSSGIGLDKTEAYKGTTYQTDYWMVKINANGLRVWDKTFGGDESETLSTILNTSDGAFVLAGNSLSGISGDKTEGKKGGVYEYYPWMIKVKGSCLPSSVSTSTSLKLTATGCTGNVTWSNGTTGNSITVNPTVATTYTAYCILNGCNSGISNAIRVTPEVIATNSVSKTARIETSTKTESEPSFNFKVFPNPAKDELMIQSDLEGEATFHLYNSIGQSVLEKTFEKQTKIDLKNLSKGSHFYLIQHDKTQTSGKILLE